MPKWKYLKCGIFVPSYGPNLIFIFPSDEVKADWIPAELKVTDVKVDMVGNLECLVINPVQAPVANISRVFKGILRKLGAEGWEAVNAEGSTIHFKMLYDM
jgi:hypothetical protein